MGDLGSRCVAVPAGCGTHPEAMMYEFFNIVWKARRIQVLLSQYKTPPFFQFQYDSFSLHHLWCRGSFRGLARELSSSGCWQPRANSLARSVGASSKRGTLVGLK
jgi:hypothetical protein